MTEAPNLQEAGTDTLSVSRTEAERYAAYEKWYKNADGLFTDLGKFVGDVSADLSRIQIANANVRLRSSVENLRNPVHRVCEFYAATMLSGPLRDMLKVEEPSESAADLGDDSSASEDEEVPLKAAILKVSERSNMDAQKQVAKRYLARDGQMFIKVVLPEGKDYCYEQFVPGKHVTDYEADERGNVTYVRLDVPDVEILQDGRTRKVWRTEIWRKGKTNDKGEPESGYALFVTSERTTEASVPIEKRLAEMPNSKRVELGNERLNGFAFDFVPFVVVNAQDTGEKRPEPVYAHGLHLIAWICREATRLSDLMFRFNKAFKVIFNAGDDEYGRPRDAPKPGEIRDLASVQREQQEMARGEHTVPFRGSRASLLSRENEDISIEGVAVIGLPGTAQMADATPNINYEAARQWISDHMREIYEALPELLYYAIESRANQSGSALRTLIAGALSRAEEMQDNLIAGLIKANKMALTISQLEGFEGFSEKEIGTYENGGFEHDIDAPEILPLTEEETQRAQQGKLTNAQSLVALLTQLDVSPEEQRRVVLTELGHEDLIEAAVSPRAAPEGTPSSEELAASQQALATRLSREPLQTPTGGNA